MLNRLYASYPSAKALGKEAKAILVFPSKATTTTVTSDIYVYVFGQKGSMAGVGIQGSKITRIKK